ncbi:MAG TPA: hypothetical protein VM266_04045 [Solirubrobacteraceae bacterium]|nr:hypothetical protein [Solirubrobacteraceae bacterium]
MRRLTVIATSLAAAALAAPAAAAPGLELAVQDDAVLLHRHYGDADLALDRAAAMGARYVRTNVRWSYSMPLAQAERKTRPARVDWDFSSLARLLDGAAARGLAVQVTLAGPAPAWATGTRKAGVNRPSKYQFARFARAAVRAAGGRVQRWSIWNEPNWHSQLSPYSKAPAIYRGLFVEGARAIREELPGAQVLFGELMPGANSSKSMALLRFLRGVTCSRADWSAARRCPRLRADGFALHPYNFARRPKEARSPNRDVVEMGSLSRLTRALDALARRGALRTPSGARMPLYLTEFGYFTSGPLRKSPKTQARWMAEAWQIARRNPRVRQLLQYQLIDPWPRSVTWRSAIMSRDGTPRPAYETLARLAAAEL